MSEHTIRHLTAPPHSGGILLHETTADADPFARQTRCLLQSDHLFERGGAKERRVTVAAIARLKETHNRPIPNVLRMATRYAVVEKGDPARPGGYYRAAYRIEPLPFVPVTLSLPVGGGDTEEFGDFSEWEGQPFKFEWAADPWAPCHLFVALRDTTPFPDDTERGLTFCRALARSRWSAYEWGIHVLGRNLSYARAVADGARVRPMKAMKPAPKGRRG